MIIIYPERLDSGTGISADSEDSNFPASNLEDDRPGVLWKADSTNEAIITIPAEADSDCVAVFNTNAESAACVLKDGVGGSTLDTENFDLTPASGRVHKQLFWNYTAQSSTCVVEITLTAAVGETIYAGVVRIGKGASFNSPRPNLSQSREDLSTVLTMSNKSRYVNKDPGEVNTRRVLRVSIVDETTDYYSFDTIMQYFGPNPMAVLLLETGDGMEWAIFAYVDENSLYNAGHVFSSVTTISFNLTEAV